MFKDLRDLTLNQTTKIIKELINKMVDITIHHVNNIEIEKYQLNSGTFVCKIKLNCKEKIINLDNYEYITLFSDNKEVYENLKI